MLYGLAVANALLVFFDFTFRHGEVSLPLRLVFALGFAVLPFLVALILARIFTSSDLGVSPSFEVNLEIFWRSSGGKLGEDQLVTCEMWLSLTGSACAKTRDSRTRREAFNVLSVGRMKTGWNKNVDRLPDNLARRVTEHSLRGLVEEVDRMLGINGYDRVACDLEYQRAWLQSRAR